MTNRLFLFPLLLIFALTGSGCLNQNVSPPVDNGTPATETNSPNLPTANPSLSYTDLDPSAAYNLIMNTADLVILDVSPRYDKGHLPGAINHYIGDGSLDQAIPGLDKTKTYLVYCHVDAASIPGAQKLVDAGFTKVYRLQGNYGPWLESGYPIEINLLAISPYTGTATATRSYLDGQFQHSVVAGISDPAPGKFYEGWLVRGTDFFSTGRLLKQNDSYTLEYTSNADSRDYKKVVITEETESLGLDNNPEAHVLEGEFE